MSRRPLASGVFAVAASDTPDELKFRADPFVCDGTDDHTTINAAIDASLIASSPGPIYAGVHLCAGEFGLRGPILIKSRGQSITGSGCRTVLTSDTGGGSWDMTGAEGAQPAMIMVADTAAGQNSCMFSIGNMYFNGTNGGGVSAVYIDRTNGDVESSTERASDATYGVPTAGTGGDTYDFIYNLRGRGLEYGLAAIGGAGVNGRGLSGHNIRWSGIDAYGYYIDQSSDVSIVQSHCIVANSSNAVGAFIGGGNVRFTHYKTSDFNTTGAWGMIVDSARFTGGDIELQSCRNGLKLNDVIHADIKARIETAYNTGVTAVFVDSAATYYDLDLKIHRRGSGIYQNGLVFGGAGGGSTGLGPNHVRASIDNSGGTAGVTNPVLLGGTETGGGSAPTGISSFQGSSGRGDYRIITNTTRYLS